MNTFFETRIEAFRLRLNAYRARRNMARTNRFLESLPDDIRKDIGWPDGRLEAAPLQEPRRGWDAETFLARTECRL